MFKQGTLTEGEGSVQ